jgi:hypothetical protein
MLRCEQQQHVKFMLGAQRVCEEDLRWALGKSNHRTGDDSIKN